MNTIVLVQTACIYLFRVLLVFLVVAIEEHGQMLSLYNVKFIFFAISIKILNVNI